MAALPEMVWKLPARHLGRTVCVYRELGSTNDRAAELAEPGVAVLALRQTRGRGQYGRHWDCPEAAGLLLSVWVSPPPELARPVVLTALACVAVADVVHRLAAVEARIKWSNDLLAAGRKICGILIEQGRGVVIGIGLNLNQSAENFADAGLTEAASLAMLAGRPFDLETSARSVLDELDRRYDQLLADGPDRLEADWRDRLALAGQWVVATTVTGQTHTGRVEKLGFAGIRIDGVTTAPELLRALGPIRDAT